ncbi:unnamed protein product, partial [Ectocarpus sp. 12 AP-2014]
AASAVLHWTFDQLLPSQAPNPVPNLPETTGRATQSALGGHVVGRRVSVQRGRHLPQAVRRPAHARLRRRARRAAGTARPGAAEGDGDAEAGGGGAEGRMFQ